MRLWKSLRFALCAAFLSLSFGATASAAVLAVDFADNPLLFRCQTTVLGCNLGYTFQVTQAVTIVSLGVFNDSTDGLNNNHPVGLWDASHSLIAQAVVDSSSTSVASASGLGEWLFTAITPFTLTPGTYTIAAFYPATQDEVIRSASTNFTADGIVLGLPVQGFAGSLTEPTTQVNTTRFGYFGPSFEIAAPEPSTAGLLVIGAAFALALLKISRARCS